mmetsp:Transcript_7403/g.9119  ORF Transcript_7403/g.9119 Transcript_7403/m.9119 type:complete len:97 (-) Transcript_7403:937-1227(-)
MVLKFSLESAFFRQEIQSRYVALKVFQFFFFSFFVVRVYSVTHVEIFLFDYVYMLAGSIPRFGATFNNRQGRCSIKPGYGPVYRCEWKQNCKPGPI